MEKKEAKEDNKLNKILFYSILVEVEIEDELK